LAGVWLLGSGRDQDRARCARRQGRIRLRQTATAARQAGHWGDANGARGGPSRTGRRRPTLPSRCSAFRGRGKVLAYGREDRTWRMEDCQSAKRPMKTQKYDQIVPNRTKPLMNLRMTIYERMARTMTVDCPNGFVRAIPQWRDGLQTRAPGYWRTGQQPSIPIVSHPFPAFLDTKKCLRCRVRAARAIGEPMRNGECGVRNEEKGQ